ncbi:unnamed protein product [Moneuplotes crassus]|uniref:EF-hand domain-containing protein n=1 Tax=Euplotes crassus TaxID=5936 RepID=A0AAD1XYP8_EUPCR|nr:unnamed protein product [Moneuplotes crassus]
MADIGTKRTSPLQQTANPHHKKTDTKRGIIKKQDLKKISELNKIKAKVKRAFEDLDEGKTGDISTKLFTSILHCLGIEINSRLLHQNVINGNVKYYQMIQLLKQELDQKSGKLQWKFVEPSSQKNSSSREAKSIDTRVSGNSYSSIRTSQVDKISERSFRSRKSINRLHNVSRILQNNEDKIPFKNTSTIKYDGNKTLTLPEINKHIPDTQSHISGITSRYGGSPGNMRKLKSITSDRYKGVNRSQNHSTTSSIADFKSTISSQASHFHEFLLQASKMSRSIDIKKALSVLKYLKKQKVPLVPYKTFRVPKFLCDIYEEILIKERSKSAHITEKEFCKLISKFVEIELDDVLENIQEGLIQVLKVQDKGISIEKLEDLLELYKYLPADPKDLNKVGKISDTKSSINKRKTGLRECLIILTDLIHSRFENSSAAFKCFNYSDQGTISKSDFQTTLHKLGLKFTNSQTISLFTTVDKNSDGYIDFPEFHRFFIETSKHISKSSFSEGPRSSKMSQNNSKKSKSTSIDQKGSFRNSKSSIDEDDEIISRSLANFKKKMKEKVFAQDPKNLNMSYTFGIKTPLPDNIKEIMTYSPLGEYIKIANKREQVFQNSRKSLQIFKKAKPTHSSIIRDTELKRQRKARHKSPHSPKTVIPSPPPITTPQSRTIHIPSPPNPRLNLS